MSNGSYVMETDYRIIQRGVKENAGRALEMPKIGLDMQSEGMTEMFM